MGVHSALCLNSIKKIYWKNIRNYHEGSKSVPNNPKESQIFFNNYHRKKKLYQKDGREARYKRSSKIRQFSKSVVSLKSLEKSRPEESVWNYKWSTRIVRSLQRILLNLWKAPNNPRKSQSADRNLLDLIKPPRTERNHRRIPKESRILENHKSHGRWYFNGALEPTFIHTRDKVWINHIYVLNKMECICKKSMG